ncbi:helix-turn-helix domain-containing protein [Patescibacteria group bacterium]|nr:helix-turn-helix domain-containing protein [Patescibacteria group bacterium]
MNSHKEIVKELEKFGLSKNQAEVYMLLVEHKELRIQEIAKLAKIPRSSVYECLKGLFELGIVEEIVEENFKRIRPYPIGTMRHGLDEKIFKLQKLTADLNDLEKAITVVPPNSRSSTIVRYYKGRSGAQQLFWNSLKAKNTTYVYSDWGRGRYVGMKFYENFVEEWRFRKLKEKVLINLTPNTLESIRKYTYPRSPISKTRIEDIRTLDKKIMPIKGDTLIYDNIYAQVYLKNVEINGFEIDSTHFTQTQRSIFETLWSIASPVSTFL